MSGHEFKLIQGDTYFRWERHWLRIEPTALHGWSPSDVQLLLFDLVGWIKRREAAGVAAAQPPEHANEHELRDWTPGVGDTVILRGQPAQILTVMSVDPATGSTQCAWFDSRGTPLVYGKFPWLALVLVSANPRRGSS